MYWKIAITVMFVSFLSTAGHTEELLYNKHIKPIIDSKCVVCHACYDAPCQLVLTHVDGLVRGANKRPVYDGIRLSPDQPTRLFVDAESTSQWREKGFFAVLPENTGGDSTVQTSVLEHLLLMRESHEFEPNSRLPKTTGFGLNRSNTCASPEELNAYREAFPYGGMPLGVTGLTASERDTLLDWIRQGAPYESPAIHVSDAERREIQTWERFFNHRSLRRQLLARWLFEHLFMAHLYFRDLDSGHFFRIVRSGTPPGKPVEPIATRRPNDEPQKPFFYRLHPVQGTIVHKTHVTFALHKGLMGEIKRLFFEDDWNIDRLPAYTDKERSNPFETFSAIPVRARYRFMLEHAEYFVRTFIRGPVCHGQIATHVIRDQFWLLFQAPDSDLYITSEKYRKQATPLMDIAGVEQDLLEGAKTWFAVKDQYDRYSSLRLTAYDEPEQPAAGVRDIWDGEGVNSNALLTVFRHHNNASVHKGLIGDYPLTVWWMDFPLFERGYYNLVVNFDVFGSVSHQAQTRLYFDLIRNDAERNFLRLMTAKARRALLDQWYEGAAQLKLMTSYQQISDSKASGVRYTSDDPKRELLDGLLETFKPVNERPDSINRRDQPGHTRKNGLPAAQRNIDMLRGIAARQAGELPAVRFFPDVSYLQLYDSAGHREIYTVIRNRMHSNVAFIFGENLRYTPSRDTLTLYPGVLASYPNFMFDVPGGELDEFVESVLAADDEQIFEKTVIRRWGVRRTHPRFWELFHALTAYLQEHDPKEAGVMDMSRYENL